MNEFKIKKETSKICIKSIYVFLKKYNVLNFIISEKFQDLLMERNLDEYWKRLNVKKIEEFLDGKILNASYIVQSFIELLNELLSKEKLLFIDLLDNLVIALISYNKIEKFDFSELKNKLIICGLRYDEIKDMKCIKNYDLAQKFSDLPKSEILPENIDYDKYSNVFEQLELPNIMFQYIFFAENILRLFIIHVLSENGYSSVDSIGNKKLSQKITDRKEQEKNQKYLPVRGNHDIYYLDLIELNNIIYHLWNQCFEDKFDRQSFLTERIESLYEIRNRVAHNSSTLSNNELKAVQTRCRELIVSVDKYINN